MKASTALGEGDAAAAGSLMAGSHRSLALDYEVSCHELDILVDTACSISGCVGARLTGAGFGGNTVNLVDEQAAEDFCVELKERYRAVTGIDSAVRVVRPARGLTVETL